MQQPVEPPNALRVVTADSTSPRLSHVCALLVLLGGAVYIPGLRWGLPATTSWSQDTIAGVRTLGAVETWPDAWAGRYAPLHYLLLRACYEPYLRSLVASGQADRDPGTGRVLIHPPHAEKIGMLLLIARMVSALMAIGAGLALCMTAHRWLGVDALGAGSPARRR